MEKTTRQDIIIGSRRFSNYLWAILLFFGGIGFLLSGISSYLKTNLLPFSNPSAIIFIPQGITMIFYGTLSFGISLYLFFTIFFDIGSGYNEYNKKDNFIKIVRKGFPGKNRQIFLTYPLTMVKSIGIQITEGLNPTRAIYLCLKDQRNIPLTPVQDPISISDLENKAKELAQFLELNLESF